MLHFSLAGAEILGARENQEDFFLLKSSNTSGGRDPTQNADWANIVVCDGMGGHAGGEVASSQASIAFMGSMNDKAAMNGRGASTTSSNPVPEILYSALLKANDQIASWIESYPSYVGMGCTLIGARVSQEGFNWVSVGDSPVFHIRNGAINQVNADHSYVSVLKDRVLAGEILESEIENHPQRNQLLSALVGEELELIDLPADPLVLQSGDHLLLTTDGIDTLKPLELLAIIGTNPDPKNTEISSQLILDAVLKKKRNFQDNTAIVCVYCYDK